MEYHYEIWLANSEPNSVSIFVNGKEHIYEVPHTNFEIYMSNGIVVRFINGHAGILCTANESPTVYWDGNMEWVEFNSELKLNWVVIIPMKGQSNITALMEWD